MRTLKEAVSRDAFGQVSRLVRPEHPSIEKLLSPNSGLDPVLDNTRIPLAERQLIQRRQSMFDRQRAELESRGIPRTKRYEVYDVMTNEQREKFFQDHPVKV